MGTVKPEAAVIAIPAPASAAVEPARNSRRLAGCDESEQEAGFARRSAAGRSVMAGAPVEGSRFGAGRDPSGPPRGAFMVIGLRASCHGFWSMKSRQTRNRLTAIDVMWSDQGIMP